MKSTIPRMVYLEKNYPVNFGCISFVFSSTSRRVENNVLSSDSLPQIQIKVDPAIQFIGSFPFEIKGIAAGTRYVFAESNGKKIKRSVIAQLLKDRALSVIKIE